jgi:hypothetical protein
MKKFRFQRHCTDKRFLHSVGNSEPHTRTTEFSLAGVLLLHGFAAFLTVLIATCATGKFGTASLVGITCSALVVLLGGPLPNIGFPFGAVIFDAITFGNR